MSFKSIIILLLVNLLYASVSIFSKFTSQQEFLSGRFFVGLALMVLMLGIYAVAWQQILKRVQLSTAYMFKGTSLIFVLMFSTLIFSEGITIFNIIGALLIISGIALFAKTDEPSN